MGWNIAFMCIRADQSQLDNIIPDVFGKTEEDLFFEDASSVMMDGALCVTTHKNWIIICDVSGRVIANESFPEEVSEAFEVKTFWIAEELIFRHYRNGSLHKAVEGIEAAGRYLQEKGIAPQDEWGETRIIQILEAEIFPDEKEEKGWDVLFGLKFDKYELD